ncbi:Hypothetical predicted protein [Podarcis lilfordi]|uniref:Uncharacterized protein n=1 Tax=Podarcis lilfordi TaxID=74358 RepID=A0AA35KWT4_9SAUR|nr:Hypothetical predicted protein [Podarcis lilfordi]
MPGDLGVLEGVGTPLPNPHKRFHPDGLVFSFRPGRKGTRYQGLRPTLAGILFSQGETQQASDKELSTFSSHELILPAPLHWHYKANTGAHPTWFGTQSRSPGKVGARHVVSTVRPLENSHWH